MDDINLQPDSIAAQALGWIDEATRAITPPIHVSSTYLRDPDNGYRSGRIYARADNPAFDQAEAVIARLENGARAALFASGMAAATAVFQALAPGDHVLALKRLSWFSVEFGLIEEDGRTKVFGAGILSSLGEIPFSLSPQVERRPFVTDQVLDTLTLEELVEHVNRATSTNQEMYYI